MTAQTKKRSKLTKVICTLGPSTNSAKIIEEMALNGMNIARINMSHADSNYKNISELFVEIQKVKSKIDLSIALDTKGREIRVRNIKNTGRQIEKDDIIILTYNSILIENQPTFKDPILEEKIPLDKKQPNSDKFNLDRNLLSLDISISDKNQQGRDKTSSYQNKHGTDISILDKAPLIAETNLTSQEIIKYQSLYDNIEFSEFSKQKHKFIEINYDISQHKQELQPGFIMNMDDNLLQLQLVQIIDNFCITKSLNNHTLKNNKSLCLPGIDLKIPIDNERDKKDILFGLKNNIDIIFLSFVNSPTDVVRIRDFISVNTTNPPLIISKIESKLGMHNLKEIITVSDGIMAARGDLACEFDITETYLLQKCITEQCRILKKPCIIATQMLESMVHNSLPTRAEITDVSSAVLDLNDCVMLSAETATGKYPIESVKILSRICEKVESSPFLDCFENLDLLEEHQTTFYDIYTSYPGLDHLHNFFFPDFKKEDLLNSFRSNSKLLNLGFTQDLNLYKISKLHRGTFLMYQKHIEETSDEKLLDIFNEYSKKMFRKEFHDVMVMRRKEN